MAALRLLRKSGTLIAPVTGTLLPLTEVPDPVFSEQVLGDGVAILPEEGTVVAPCRATVSEVVGSRHAIALTADDGLEVLIHVGIDTAECKGEGFTYMVEKGARVRPGQPLLYADLPFLRAHGCNLITPVIVINGDRVEQLHAAEGAAERGVTPILRYVLR